MNFGVSQVFKSINAFLIRTFEPNLPTPRLYKAWIKKMRIKVKTPIVKRVLSYNCKTL